MASVEFDASEIREFTHRLQEAGAKTQREVKGVINKGALNIKNQMRKEASGSRHFGQIASTITYDLTEWGAFGGGVVEAEVGPNKHFRAARLGNVAYFGTSKGGGTLPDPIHALEAEIPNVERWLGDAAEDSL